MTMIANYPTKKECRANIGRRLRYTETSMFGPEYRQNGVIYVANRPEITGSGHYWDAAITMKDGLISEVAQHGNVSSV